MTRFFANANYDFIGFRKYAYGLTAAILVPGLIFLAIFGLHYSIEFTGGTLVQVRIEKALAHSLWGAPENAGPAAGGLKGDACHAA